MQSERLSRASWTRSVNSDNSFGSTEAVIFWYSSLMMRLQPVMICCHLLSEQCTLFQLITPRFWWVLATTRGCLDHAWIGLWNYSLKIGTLNKMHCIIIFLFCLIFRSQMSSESFTAVYFWHVIHYMAFCMVVVICSENVFGESRT